MPTRPPRRRRAIIAALLAAGGLSSVGVGCRIGPDYRGTPGPPMEPTYWQRRDVGMIDADDLIGDRDDRPDLTTTTPIVWSDLADDHLSSLISLAQSDNPSLTEARWRIVESRSLACIVAGQRCPFAEGFAGYETRKRSDNAQPFVGVLRKPFDFWTIGTAARWEIDIVGRIAKEVEAARADIGQQTALAGDVRRLISGEVARQYILLRQSQRQLDVTRENLAIQRKALAVVEDRIAAGKVTRLDEVQLRSRLELTEAGEPVFAQNVETAYHALSRLTGTTPGPRTAYLLNVEPQLAPEGVDPGLPADLLRRRPDVRAAERRVARECALVGVARSEYYPRLALLGTLAFESRKGSNLFEYESLAFAIGPQFTWNILSLGRIESAVAAQRARVQQAVANYQTVVLAAAAEVEDALAAQRRQRQRAADLREAVETAEEAVELSLEQYEAGKVTIERVVSNQRRLLRAQLELTDAEARSAEATVNAFQAIGGGAATHGGGC